MSEHSQFNPKRDSVLAAFVLEDVKPKAAPTNVSEQRDGWNAAFRRALVEAQDLYPNDGIARHRYASRAADRASQPASPLDDSQQTTDHPFGDSLGDDHVALVGPEFGEFIEGGQ
jgi:hypothetical protein